jgi:hypothetical protein
MLFLPAIAGQGGVMSKSKRDKKSKKGEADQSAKSAKRKSRPKPDEGRTYG